MNNATETKDDADLKRVPLDTESHSYLKRIAEQDDRTIQATARVLIREEAERRGITPKNNDNDGA